MNDTMKIKAYYERTLLETLESLVSKIKSEGYSEDAYTKMRLLQDDLAEANAVNHFVDAWHTDAS